MAFRLLMSRVGGLGFWASLGHALKVGLGGFELAAGGLSREELEQLLSRQ